MNPEPPDPHKPPLARTPMPRGMSSTSRRRVITVRRKASPATVALSLSTFLVVALAGVATFWWLSRPDPSQRDTEAQPQGDTGPLPPQATPAQLLKRAEQQIAEAASVAGAAGTTRVALQKAVREAVSTLSSAIDQQPDNHRAYYLRSRARALEGETDSALEDAARAVSLDTGRAPYHFQRAVLTLEIHMRAHRLARLRGEPVPDIASRSAILDDFRTAERTANENVDTDYLRAAIALLERRFPPAIEILDKAIAKGGREYRFRLRGAAYELQGTPALAVTDFDKCLQLRPLAVELIPARALARREALDFEGAEKDATTCLELLPDRNTILLFRAEVRAFRRDPKGALADAATALKALPDSRRALLVTARARLALGEQAEALATAARLLKADPLDVEALQLQAHTHLWAGDVERAEEFLNRALQSRPEAAALFAVRSEARLWGDDVKGALADAEKAVSLSEGRDARALIARADVRLRVANHAQALLDYRAARPFDPRESRAQRGIALSLLAARDREGAVLSVQEALRIDSRNPDLIALLAEVLRRCGDTERALQYAGDAIRMDPRSADAHWTRALVWRRKGEKDRMEEDLRRAAALRPLYGKFRDARLKAEPD